MAYVFPPIDARTGNHKSYKQDLVYLTRSDKTRASTEFCKSLLGRYRLTDFDAVKDDICSIRNRTGAQNKFCSVDCFATLDDTYYFIEFKNATASRLNGIEWYEGQPIDVSLRRKAFDSLAIAPLTVLQATSGSFIMDHAEFIVVYVPDAEEAMSGIDIRNKIKRLAGCADSLYPELPVRWDLESLRDDKLFRDVHTWPAPIFEQWAMNNLNRAS